MILLPFIEIVQLICADYPQVARSATRRLAKITKRKPCPPLLAHAVAIARMRKTVRYRINPRKARRQQA